MMKKTGITNRLKKGRYVSLYGPLKVSQNTQGEKTFVNLDIWISNIDVPFTANAGHTMSKVSED